MSTLNKQKEIRPPGDELDAVGKVSIDPIGGPQGPYFSTEFEKIDTDNDGLITWKQLCEANPHVWVEEERRVHYLEMFDSLKHKMTKQDMLKYIARLKQDLPCGSKYGRPWPYGERPPGARRKINWSRRRVREHRANMPWHERFDQDRGFVNYYAMSDEQLHELLQDQNQDMQGDTQQLIDKLVELRDADSEYAEEIFVADPDKYMNGKYNERNNNSNV
jgi:hypothetical protein